MNIPQLVTDGTHKLGAACLDRAVKVLLRSHVFLPVEFQSKQSYFSKIRL